MIEKMERLSVFGLIGNKDAMLKKLIRKQCIQLIDPEELLGDSALYTSPGRPDTSAYHERLIRFESALDEMKPYTGKTGMFPNRPHLTYTQLESDEFESLALTQCIKIETLINELNSTKLTIDSDVGLKNSLIPWISSDIPLEIKSTGILEIAYFALPPDTNRIELAQDLELEVPSSCIENIFEDKEHKYIIVICHKEHFDSVLELMDKYDANTIHFSDGVEGTPSNNIEEIEARLLKYESDADEIIGQLDDLGGDLSPLQYGCDALSLKIAQEEANDKIILTNMSFGFSGWVPTDRKPDVLSILDEYNCEYNFKSASKENDEIPPVLFKNKVVAQSTEAVVQMYSLPDYFSVDPNYVVAPFFALFFGMMLSDAAYGLILFLGGMLVIKKLDISRNMKSIVRTLMFGGLSAIFWGIFYGSWFGDISTIVAKTFFNVNFVMPSFLNPLDDPVTVLIISLSLGMLHIIVGMGVKAYLLIIRGHFWSAVFDVGFWYVLFAGVGIIFLGGDASTAGIYVTIAGAAGLILTQGRKKKGFFPRLIGGVASLYNIVGYFSDILSYSRILALGLSTAVIASVFNTMGSMAGGNILGALLLIVVFVIGHTFNIMISSFGAYVHTARLHYVEFFGEFYESGGSPFEPYRYVPKYCHIDE